MENAPLPFDFYGSIENATGAWELQQKLLLLSLKQQRFDREHCTIIGSLDGLAKNAIDIARVTGLWRKAPGL
jgi:hypothetical protein